MGVLTTGLYEQLINKLVATKLEALDHDVFYVHSTTLDKTEAARYLAQYLSETIHYALNEITNENRPARQVDLANKIILLLMNELRDQDFSVNLIEAEGKLLEGVFRKLDAPYADLGKRIQEIMPYTRLSQSELFTGSRTGISMESEIKKEILSADRICMLVSFIKWSGIRIFQRELEEFTTRQIDNLSGLSTSRLQIITTSYMGATDLKAIEFLSSLPNTEVKISYNTKHERLHAKAWLFMRNSGFHTGYIGSSNISRAALTNGLEWNIKVTTREIGHIIDKFEKTFETYWNDREFEIYRTKNEFDRDRLSTALKTERTQSGYQDGISTFFDLKPYTFQVDVLEKLQSEREIHHRFRNLIVAATGTGKTIMSAFDFHRFREKNPQARFLFVAHRVEILQQACITYRHILRDSNFGELWVDGQEPSRYDQLFASVFTLKNRLKELPMSENFYDYIVIDEVHHITANSYRPILNRFSPQILLGLTATPERMDGADILEDFDNRIAAEIRLPEALNRKLLSPFQYFGISDTIDLSNVKWTNGRYEIGELTRLYTQNDQRVGQILNNCQKYLTDIHEVKALCFCVSQEHARYMAEKFTSHNLKANYLTSANSTERGGLRQQLLRGDINYLFVVDIFNEGVDIPEIDTVLFLRPTESLTIFLQQLGRGLRIAEGKDCLTVLDFVGNARPEYDFEHKFRALVGRTHTSIIKEIEDDFPNLPLGCSIVLEKQAREVILKNIQLASDLRRPKLLGKIRDFRHQSTLTLSLKNFLTFHQLELKQIYKHKIGSTYMGWSRLCFEAGVHDDFIENQENQLSRFISQRLITTSSLSYFKFLKELIRVDFDLNKLKSGNHSVFSDDEFDLLGLMFHYDVWQESGIELKLKSLQESLFKIGENKTMISELSDVIDILIDQINHTEIPIELGFPMPLMVHGRYTRDQILVAMQLHLFGKKSSNREGVAENKNSNTEALFVTLKKTEMDYSSSTMYEDYAVNEELFHWQSQNATSPESSRGQSYIHHRKNGKAMLLFVREQNKDEYGNTMSYVFLGEVAIVDHQGSKPMNITWKLNELIPGYLLTESRKLAVG
jgi:superfamily II DNA or RNA helicase